MMVAIQIGSVLRGALLSLALLGAAAALVACAGDDCGDCTQGCCRDGQCVELLAQQATSCGFGGVECTDCTQSSMVCDTTRGMCAMGTAINNGTGTTQLNPNPGTTPIQDLGTCSDCTGGCCDGPTGRCIPEGQPCSATDSVCRSGSCQFEGISGGGNPPLASGDCPGCYAPWECKQGRCIGPVESCMEVCDGCCTNQGKCNALGSAQSDYACGRDGQMCDDCGGGGRVCNEQRGACEAGAPGDWEVCVIRAVVAGQYLDCPDADANAAGQAPEMYVEFRFGGTHKETGTVTARKEGGSWVGAWVSDRACVKLPGSMASNDGVTVLVKDSDWGVGCGWSGLGDFSDDLIGECTLYTGGIRPGDSFVRIGTEACRNNMQELELKFTALPGG